VARLYKDGILLGESTPTNLGSVSLDEPLLIVTNFVGTRIKVTGLTTILQIYQQCIHGLLD